MMNRLILPLMAAALALAGCGNTEDADRGQMPDTPQDAPAAESADAGTPDAAASDAPRVETLTPGNYCYFRDDADVTEALELTVAEDGQMTGDNYGVIHQEDASYYASFTVEMTGGQPGEDGLVAFDTVTEVDGDTQTGEMRWHLSPDQAAPDGLETHLESAACEGLDARVQSAADTK